MQRKEAGNQEALLDLSGMEKIFEPELEPIKQSISTVPSSHTHTAEHSASQSNGLTLKAACRHYKLAPSTLRAKIKKGEIAAEKIEGANGPEWRVFPAQRILSTQTKHSSKHGANHSADILSHVEQTIANDAQNPLLVLIEKQTHKLEAAAGQIGYLSAQLQTYEKQVLMLPDLESKARRAQDLDRELQEMKAELDRLKGSWWYRFTRFLSGSK